MKKVDMRKDTNETYLEHFKKNLKKFKVKSKIFYFAINILDIIKIITYNTITYLRHCIHENIFTIKCIL